MDPGEPALLFRAVPAGLRPTTHDKRSLRAFASDLSKCLGEGRSFTCLITNDQRLRKLNRDFLGHDYATDVLSFSSDSGSELGDLAISSQRAHAQAAEFGHSLYDEFRILMLHGVLHLIGFDHERDRGQMKREERKWRTEFRLPNTLIGRANGVSKR
jgi:probable rRNA maturation factor